MPAYLLCFASLLGGGLVQALSGFGFGIFAMSLLPYFMPSYGLSIAVVNVAMLLGTAPLAYQRRKEARWRLIGPLLIGYVVSNALAVYFVYRQPEALLFHLLGILLLLLSAYFTFFGNRLRLRATPLTGIAAGVLSGAMNGLFSMGGPPVALYLLSATENEKQYLACTLNYFLVTNLYTLLMRFLNGGITADVFPYLLFAALAAVIVSIVSRKMDGRLSAKTVRRAVYAMMAVSGIVLLFK